MLTIKSRDTSYIRAVNYSLVLGSLFIISSFLQKYSALTLAIFLVSEAVMLIWLFSKRRTQLLKIQGKRLDVAYGSTHTKIWTSYYLADLDGEIVEYKPAIGTSYSILRVFRGDKLVCSADTRKGFEKSKLKILLSSMKVRVS